MGLVFQFLDTSALNMKSESTLINLNVDIISLPCVYIDRHIFPKYEGHMHIEICQCHPATLFMLSKLLGWVLSSNDMHLSFPLAPAWRLDHLWLKSHQVFFPCVLTLNYRTNFYPGLKRQQAASSRYWWFHRPWIFLFFESRYFHTILF